MDTETVGTETPAADAPAIEQVQSDVAQPSESTTEQQEAPAANDGDGADTTAEPKKKHWAHERIDDLTRKYRDAERDAQYWREKAQAPVPKLDEYDDYDDFVAAKAVHAVNTEQATSKGQDAQRYIADAFEARAAVASERLPDFDAIVRNPKIAITGDMAVVIQSSELGPEMAYHLGKNPSEALRIAQMPAQLQAAEMGKLEVRLSAPAPQRKPLPEPVDTVTGASAGVAKDYSKMTMAEYVEARKRA